MKREGFTCFVCGGKLDIFHCAALDGQTVCGDCHIDLRDESDRQGIDSTGGNRLTVRDYCCIRYKGGEDDGYV